MLKIEQKNKGLYIVKGVDYRGIKTEETFKTLQEAKHFHKYNK